jgi:hypothetical protein
VFSGSKALRGKKGNRVCVICSRRHALVEAGGRPYGLTWQGGLTPPLKLSQIIEKEPRMPAFLQAVQKKIVEEI